MYVIVVGCGEVGRYISEVLLREGHDVVIVDNNREKLNRMENVLDARTHLGSGSSISVLKAVETERADLFVAVSNNDEVNMIGAALAKRLGCKRVIARFSSQEHLGEARRTYQNLLGIDLIISPKQLVSQDIVRLIRHPGIVAMEDFARGRIRMIELTIPAGAKFVFKHLKDIPLPPGTLVTSIQRGGEVIIPGGEDILTPGDNIFVIGDRESTLKVEKLLGRAEKKTRRVVIIGGGEIGMLVARILERMRVDVVIIEKDLERCEELASELNETRIINGDGTNLEMLKEIQIEGFDALISVSKDDEINLLSGLLGKELGVKRTIILAHKPDYVQLYERLGIDSTISPRLVTATETIRFIKQEALSRVAILAEGKAEILESQVDRNSPLVGKPLKDVDFPKGAIVGAVLRGEDEVIIPRGDFQMEPGDRAVVFCRSEAMNIVEKMLR
jgi:trk system potassium uptake protein TrkA